MTSLSPQSTSLWGQPLRCPILENNLFLKGPYACTPCGPWREGSSTEIPQRIFSFYLSLFSMLGSAAGSRSWSLSVASFCEIMSRRQPLSMISCCRLSFLQRAEARDISQSPVPGPTSHLSRWAVLQTVLCCAVFHNGDTGFSTSVAQIAKDYESSALPPSTLLVEDVLFMEVGSERFQFYNALYFSDTKTRSNESLNMRYTLNFPYRIIKK